jgi:hypothetical protein
MDLSIFLFVEIRITFSFVFAVTNILLRALLYTSPCAHVHEFL